MPARASSSPDIPRDELFNVHELARAMGISVALVRWRLANRPEWLPPVTHIDGTPFFDIAAYNEWQIARDGEPAEIGALSFGSSTTRLPRPRQRRSPRRQRPRSPVVIDAPSRKDISIDPGGPAPWAE